jgi:hypothetical protein
MRLPGGGPPHDVGVDCLGELPRFFLFGYAQMRTAVRSNFAARRRKRIIPPRVEQALDSMRVLAEFSVSYAQGGAIPDDIRRHGRIVADYLGYPEQWLWQWLNGSWRD